MLKINSKKLCFSKEILVIKKIKDLFLFRIFLKVQIKKSNIIFPKAFSKMIKIFSILIRFSSTFNAKFTLLKIFNFVFIVYTLKQNFLNCLRMKYEEKQE